MAEQPVFWLGGKPGGSKEKARQAPAAERFEPAIREACIACGYEVDEYVAALGGFGGWLTHLERGGRRYRLFWNGKAKRMIFEEAQAHGGWQEHTALDLADEGLPVFVEAVKAALSNSSGQY